MESLKQIFKNISLKYLSENTRDKAYELVEKVIDALDKGKLAIEVITLQWLAVLWGVAVNKVSAMIESIYDNVYSFDFTPFMDKIEADYMGSPYYNDINSFLIDRSEPDVYNAETDKKKEKERELQYNWEKFSEEDKKMAGWTDRYGKRFPDMETQRDRIKIFFNWDFEEKALLRFSLGLMTEEQLNRVRIAVRAFLLIVPSPF